MAEGALPTGTVTFLFTDIEGSTKLLQELGRERYRAVEEEQAALLRRAIEESDGRVIRTEGDSFFAVFPTPTGAVGAAIAAQRALAEHPFSHGEPLRVRIGMHTGEGHVGGGDYVGIDVNRAARIAAAGHGGQVLLSEATRVLVEHDLPAGVAIRDLGAHRLKGIAHPERIHDLDIDGLPSEFPPLKSLAVTSNLPARRTSFVGRLREVRVLAELLGSARLVTLVGPGGTGKTRLAVRVGEEVLPAFGGGVYFVDLSSIRDPAFVPSAITKAVGLPETPGRSPLEVATAFLAERRVLLVLDNFEQVIQAAPAVDELIEGAPESVLLVTSRLRLGLPGEHVFAVDPLDPPAVGETDPQLLARNEAVALFVDRARAARNGFALTQRNAAAVADICARLEGVPLAIELAAVQVRLLSPQEIVSRLDARLGGLGAGPRNLPERQRTLRSTIQWSYDLLGRAEQSLFARLSVFAGGATLEGVEAVCNPEAELETDTLEAVATLLDHSLIRRVEVQGGSRFTMLETIREFAHERLEEGGEAGSIRERHAAFYAALAETAEPDLTLVDREAWADRLERDQGNLRAALGWSIETDRADLGLRLVASLWRYWQSRGHVTEGRKMAAEMLAVPSAASATRERARALLAMGSLAYWQDDVASGRGPYEEGVSLARKLGERDVLAEALIDLAYVEVAESNFDAADGLFLESAETWQQLGNRLGLAWVNVGRALACSYQDRHEEAVVLLEEALPVFREFGHLYGVENALGGLAHAEYRLGHLDRAEEWMLETFRTAPMGSPLTAVGLAGMASLALGRGDAVKAVRLWGAVETIQETSGVRVPLTLTPLGDTRREALAALNEETGAAAREEGRRMTIEEAIRYATGEDER